MGAVIRSLAISGAQHVGAQWGGMTVELEWVGAALCILRKRTAPFPHGGVVRPSAPPARAGDAKAPTA